MPETVDVGSCANNADAMQNTTMQNTDTNLRIGKEPPKETYRLVNAI